MSTKRIQKNRKNEDGSYSIIHYETDADVVLMDDGSTLQESFENVATIPGGAAMTVTEIFGEGPYTIEFTPDGEADVTADLIGYDNTVSGIEATEVQSAIDKLSDTIRDTANAASNAQTTANEAKTAAENAQTAANEAKNDTYSKIETLSDSTKESFGLEPTATPNDVFALLASGAVGGGNGGSGYKIVVGSYEGSGTYGEANPNSLSFDSEVELVIMTAQTQGTHYSGVLLADVSNSNNSTWRNLSMTAAALKTTYIAGAGLGGNGSSGCISEDKKTIYWYNAGSATDQFNGGGYVYYYMAIVKQTSSGSSGSASKPTTTTVTLTVSDWDTETKTQTVAVPGILADELAQMIDLVPTTSSRNGYYTYGIMATGQDVDSITFTADVIPTDDLTVYVVVQEL